ncbi:MAG: hypothetical protein HOI88_05450 [Phycisphaerae bacterium]|jgi:hypothetical protein|nr:hypothetical protein [Phycisphaerae bacterium]MBT5365426.1 hypothetical protein [Phycisphaerae bacterium]MBT6269777.1 hypothetical protein [Phycisphaerae bacterium]MBT6283402.1 hypothetical protein [Phycisphaerae bacterium]
MVLLLFGLAFLLATSSSLLVDSRTGGEDRGRDEDRSLSVNQSGEISGSVSITASGELWLTVFIDELSILAQIEVITNQSEGMRYRFSVSAISSPDGTLSQVSSHVLQPASEENRFTEFSSQNDAANNLIRLFDEMGIAISIESLKSIPYAITCAWKSPEECQQFIEDLINGANKNER